MTEQNQRPRAEVLADAIGVLTEAARLRHPVLQQVAPGAGQPDPNRLDQSDWAEFVSQALAGAAANFGSVDAILAGRPGSWEADSIRNLLLATVGHDEAYLHEHRTEPLRVTVPVDQILAEQGLDELYEALHTSLDAREVKALGEVVDDAPYLWHYDRTDAGGFVSSDPEAPPFSMESWRSDRQADGYPPERIAQIERTVFDSPLTRSVYVAKSPKARAKAQRLDGQAHAIQDGFRRRHEALDALRGEERTTFGQAIVAAVRDRAASVYPGVPIEVEATDDPVEDPSTTADGFSSPEQRLLQHAREHTRWPGSVPAPTGYSLG
ncbi:hypothetical protein BSP109_02160 [Brevibacterium sp. Mu109]|uniref:hypothetical protein n=1 Tax=Brevibacterium sp. Mu109 TaxID=1255669 RepID=UPI000C3F0053|nr:hypothetical protein [Brevibacterium sp. Mu109]SMX86918.1 hypothetical protein BSP109_02160 [Brevibacterium sp. Mu109]